MSFARLSIALSTYARKLLRIRYLDQTEYQSKSYKILG